MDLCLSIDTYQALQTAHLLGFKKVALNRTVLATSDLRSHRAKFEATEYPGLEILKRLTVSPNQASQLAQLGTLDFKSMGYDILAIRPMNESVLRAILEAKSTPASILSLDLTQPLLTLGMRPALADLLASGTQLEVEFAANCLRDASGRVQCINQCRHVLSTFKSGVFLSSGAKSVLEMRSPTDLINFSQVLGLRLTKL